MRDRYQPRLGMVVGVLLVCAILFAREQQPLRSRVLRVPVDVRVVDAKGNTVSDLTKADFAVAEDGVVQEIAHFAMAAPERVTTSQADPAFEAPSQQRTFLIVLGRGDLEGPVNGLTAVRNFVATGLRPTDKVGMIAHKRATDLTTDHPAIVKLLKANYRSIEQTMRAFSARLSNRSTAIRPSLR